MVVVDNRKSSYHACEAVGVAAAARKIASSRAYSHLNAEARWERRNRRHQPPPPISLSSFPWRTRARCWCSMMPRQHEFPDDNSSII